MDKTNIAERTKKVVAERYFVPVNESDSFDTLGDSLDAIQVIQDIEDEFEIRISEKDAANLKTVGDLIAYLQQL